MTTLEQIYAKHSQSAALERIYAAQPKFGCLMAMLPSLESELPHWASENIPAETLAADGIETETHVTVLYGFNLNFDSSKLRHFFAGHPVLKIKLGKLTRFDCPEYDVLKFDVICPELEKLHKELNSEFSGEITPSKWDYRPHVTVAYVKKGTNKHLTGKKFEGMKVASQQLLYSLPEKEGRIVIDLGGSVSASLASRIENVLQAASLAEYYDWRNIHEDIQNQNETLMRHAVDRTVNYAQAQATKAAEDKKTAKKRLDDLEGAITTLFFVLMEEAQQDALKTSYNRLGELEGLEQSEVPSEQAKRFIEERRAVLGGFPAEVASKLKEVVEQGIDEELSPDEIRARIAAAASALKAGRGKVVAATEGQAVYGSAQLWNLQRAGFKTAIWNTEHDELVRESHADQDGEERPLGQKFSNGCRFPGDPKAEAGEVINCRCWLTGGRRV